MIILNNNANQIIINNNSNKKEVILGNFNNINPLLLLRHSNSSYITNTIHSGLFEDNELNNNNRKEHEHQLVFCITIFNWRCEGCKRNLFGNNPRFYCSLCDFNLCLYCKDENSVLKLKEFDICESPELKINQKFIKSFQHEHRLVYLSRRVNQFDSWRCNICNNAFLFEKWSFYCTECDFDICSKCLKI